MPKPVEFRSVKIQLDIPIAAAPDKVWTALTRDVGRWWPRDFCIAPTRTRSFRIELKLGGRVYEDWGNGNGLVWWTINSLDAENHTFQALGYEGSCICNSVRFSLQAVRKKTNLHITEQVWGDLPDHVVRIHTEGWKTLFRDGFKVYVEKKHRSKAR